LFLLEDINTTGILYANVSDLAFKLQNEKNNIIQSEGKVLSKRRHGRFPNPSLHQLNNVTITYTGLSDDPPVIKVEKIQVSICPPGSKQSSDKWPTKFFCPPLINSKGSQIVK